MESKNSRDIQNQRFDTSFRGYDKSQVDNYLKLISKEFEILESKCSKNLKYCNQSVLSTYNTLIKSVLRILKIL